MYDELVKRLRMRARLFKQINQMENCIMDEAANAIEELQGDKAALNGTVTNLLEQIKDLGKPRWVPVPEHGRLIDADALSAKLNTMLSMAFGEGNTAFCFAYRSLEKMVENAPTIIPAEEGE